LSLPLPLKGLEFKARDRFLSTEAFRRCPPISQLASSVFLVVPAQDSLGELLVDADAAITPHILCDRCIELSRMIYDIWTDASSISASGEDKNALFPLESLFHHYDFSEELELSCQRGCHLCTIMWLSLNETKTLSFKQPFAEADKAQRFQSRVLIDITYSSNEFLMTAVIARDGCIIGGEELNILGPSNRLSRNLRDMSLARLCFSNASEKAFALAKGWVHRCLTEHSRCKEAVTVPSHVPTRLIDVGSPHEPNVRLVCGKFLESRPSYLCLSHCWGGASVLKLVSRNLDEFQRSIPMESLARSFQDAVIITRNLGYQYLWIDALCIIQDSEEDWNKEAAIMGDIYHGAVCTIAAVAAQDSHQGLFAKENPLTQIPCILSGSSENALHVCRDPGWSYGPAPLHRRAWVVQERVLSPRIISYTQQGVIGTCSTWEYTEAHPNGIDLFGAEELNTPGSGYGLEMSFQRLVLDLGQKYDNESFSRFYKNWSSILSAYTEASLTYEKDRPVALNGLLDFLHKQTGLTFLAGMCEQYMIQELLWYSISPRTQTSKDSVPSWSCALRYGKFINEHDDIEFPDHRVFMASVLETRTDPPAIRCEGLACKAQVKQDNKQYQLELNETNRAPLSPLRIPIGQNDDTDNCRPLELNFRPDISPLSTGEVLLLLICRKEETSGPGTGLVLRKSTEIVGEYMRIGYFSLDYHGLYPPWVGEDWVFQSITLV